LGTVGALVPLVSREDVEFWSMLEMHLRTENQSLVGRDHLAYRGCQLLLFFPIRFLDMLNVVLFSDYAPPKAVIDGDLCETFARLPTSKQAQIASELDRTVPEVLKKLEGQRVFAAGF
jgi:splicing factor 3B subunit 3